ncbi:hypothetical protein [Hyalangium gracile]|uniref:hypothetical protein n=1 Tax=Hyalangium gracile TaxID=394092 RepID=UPI001CCB781F|nr:hypothetical protein [Hyalangium gracile]
MGFSDLIAKHHGAFSKWDQNDLIKQVPKLHKEGVCAGACAVFLYTHAIRKTHQQVVPLFAKSSASYEQFHQDFVTKKFSELEEDDEADIAVIDFLDGVIGKNFSESFDKTFPQDSQDLWRFRGRDDSKSLEKKRRLKETHKKKKESGYEVNPMLSFKNFVQFRGTKPLAVVQGTQGEFQGSKAERAQGLLNAVSYLSFVPSTDGKAPRRVQLPGQTPERNLFSLARSAHFKRNQAQDTNKVLIQQFVVFHGYYYITVLKHATAAFVDHHAKKYKYFEPNHGVAKFTNVKDLGSFLAEWLYSSEYDTTTDVDMVQFL